MQETPDLYDVTLAVLAGGRGSRMGMAKDKLHLGGKPVLRYLLEKWNWPGPKLVVTAPGREHPEGWEAFDAEVTDAVEQGPLRGILTALENVRTEFTLIATLDMPMFDRAQLEWLVARLRADEQCLGLMIQRAEGRVEPFPLTLNYAAKEKIAAQLAAGNLAVHSLASLANFKVKDAPDWPASTWLNLNTPADYQAFKQREGGG